VTEARSPDYTLTPLSGDQYTSCLCGGERKTLSWTMTPTALGEVRLSTLDGGTALFPAAGIYRRWKADLLWSSLVFYRRCERDCDCGGCAVPRFLWQWDCERSGKRSYRHGHAISQSKGWCHKMRWEKGGSRMMLDKAHTATRCKRTFLPQAEGTEMTKTHNWLLCPKGQRVTPDTACLSNDRSIACLKELSHPLLNAIRHQFSPPTVQRHAC